MYMYMYIFSMMCAFRRHGVTCLFFDGGNSVSVNYAIIHPYMYIYAYV